MRSRIVFATLVAALMSTAAAAQDCAPEIADVRVGDSRLRFRVEVADDEAERAQGLMFRENLPRFGGMLFVYEQPQPVAFWMKNTLIPLDMLFFDSAGRLVSIHENAVPGDLTSIPGGEAIQYVLEINGGGAQDLGIVPGAELRHPAIEQDNAVWSCPTG